MSNKNIITALGTPKGETLKAFIKFFHFSNHNVGDEKLYFVEMSNLTIGRFFNVLPSEKIFPITEGVQRRFIDV